MKKTQMNWICGGLLTLSLVGMALDQRPASTEAQLAGALLAEHTIGCDDDYTAIDTRFIFPDRKNKPAGEIK